MIRHLLVIILIAIAPLVQAQSDNPEAPSAESLRALVDSVRRGKASRLAELAERERRFIDARDDRAALLAEVQKEREAAEAEANRLRLVFEQGELELGELEDLLDERSGDLTDVFAVVTTAAGDALPIIQNSMVSAQYGERQQLLRTLSSAESLPTAQQLREFWLLLLEEMLRSGEVARFELPIITASGEEAVRPVTRIGTFTALSEGEYLRFLPESSRLLALARQPAAARGDSARVFEAAEEPLRSVVIDPSRGSILALVVQAPAFAERLNQGGYIGYLILALGAVGLLLALERMIVILRSSRLSKAALAGDESRKEEAINRIRGIVRNQGFQTDSDALSAKLDEIVAVAAQRLRRGLPTLAIFAAVSPLLGLLGTVTGMIETFQVITLFGAGDPRLMSGGISQALITTQLGLAVAIPLLLIHSWLQSRANGLIAQLDEVAADLFARSRVDGATHA